MSDVTTNIIRGPLIEYTQEQCRQLGIPLVADVPSGPIWHPARREWITKFVELPMTKTGKLLLVPKAIVRRTSLYDMQEYYRHFMLEHMQREELKAGSALITMLKKGPKVHKTDLIEKYGGDKKAVIAQTMKYPDVLDEYRREKGKRPFLPLSHEDLENVEGDPPIDWDSLLNAVTSLPTGTENASAYEKAIEALLTALFYPDLVHPVYQHEIHDGRKRIDIKYTNMGGAGFFAWLCQRCHSRRYDMAYKELAIALSMFVATSPVLATSREPVQKIAPPGTEETRYCLRVEPVIGSRLETVRCWTRKEWAAMEIDVDKEWAKEGVKVIG